MPQDNQQNREVEIRSEEVQEILSHVPNWIIRWGISLIFGIIILFLFLAWLIKYPDVMKGTTTLTTVEPPIKLVAKSAGEIELFQYRENTDLKRGQVIAIVPGHF
jgi:multidrug efflux pump subunit AcrA (membrane-fusion protein)